MKVTDKLAFISPCIAKKLEIDDPNNQGLVNYNVTFDHLMEYAEKHSLSGEPCTDEIEYGLGSIYPMPGGLKENVLWLLGSDAFVRQVEGEKRLYHYLERNKKRLTAGNTPYLFVDALNCENGCLCGTGTELSLSVTDNALCSLHDIQESVKKNTDNSPWSRTSSPEERLESLNRQFAHLKPDDYIRKYTDRSGQYVRRIPNAEELDRIFTEMNKLDDESRHINCSCCGYDTCRDMAIAIYNDFNHKDNCIHYLKDMLALKASETDIMTGLPNTTGFGTHVNSLREKGALTSFNAFYLNIRNFGLVNKRFGKHAADRILMQYADVLSSFISDDECVARLSGDCFVMLIRKEKTDQLLNMLRGVDIKAEINEAITPVSLQAITGCLDIDDNTLDGETILGRCSTALNVARHRDRVPYLFSTAERQDSVMREKQLLDSFPIALANSEFKAFYQPTVDTETNTLIGAEALVRWIKKGRIIRPDEFIPILETDDSICKLDFFVFESVCRDIRRWIDEGTTPVRISTNFSRKNLADPDFSNHIREILNRYDIPREFIEVELTETMSEEENDRLSHFIRSMHDANIVMAIDDFGTGYSSINLLRDFPADVLKLDKSFIDKHTNTKRDNVVVANIARMAKELNMSVITEGVENWDQVNFLKGVDIKYVQGYLFDKPMSREDFELRLANRQYDGDGAAK